MAKNNTNVKSLCVGKDTVPIVEFSLKKMVQYAIICIVAKRGSGKSWIVRSLLHHYRDIPVGTIICPTDKLHGFYKSFFPDLYVHYEYISSTISEIIARQIKMIEKYKKYLELGKIVDPRAMIIMDDCLADAKAWANDTNIKELFLNGRHYKILYILTMQFALGIKPDLRDNIDYVFLLKQNKVTEQKKLWQHYAGIFPTFNAFRTVFSELTKDYGAMVINNREGDEFIDTIFYFKAKKIEKMKLGCRQFNRAHEKNFDENWMKKENVFNIDTMLNNKNKLKININKKDDNTNKKNK